jgi:hypothetical protein
MDSLKELIIFLLVLIPIGGVARIAYCSIEININDPDEAKGYKKRIRNVFIFVLAAELINSIVLLVQSYYI